jgi:probable F420-dependent oxidoreductase
MLLKPVDGLPSLGLFGLNADSTVGRDAMGRIGALCEELGYESLWVGEHPLLPDPQVPGFPYDARLRIADPLVALSFLAAVTHRVRLATGIVLLPLHSPVILAKQLASLDVLCGGRLTFGFGMGYIEAETAAVGVPFQDRGRRGEEHLEAMRALWYQDRPAYHGRYVGLDHVDAHPRPLQGDLPVVAGGHSAAAHRRAVTMAHGWFGFNIQPARVAAHLEGLEKAARRHPRPERLGPLEITIAAPRGPVSRELVEEYARAGVHRLVLWPPEGIGVQQVEAYVREHAELVAPRSRSGPSAR